MFDTIKFGIRISELRKRADMTQSELADKLNVTRQAVSRYELGISFPDISILLLICQVFSISIDELISFGEPSSGETHLLKTVAIANKTHIKNSEITNAQDLIGVAPFLKPSVVSKIAESLYESGIDISNIVDLAQYLSENKIIDMIENTTLETMDYNLLGKLIPVMSGESKQDIFAKIIDGELDYRLLKFLDLNYSSNLVEAAVIEGALPYDALRILHEVWEEHLKRKNESKY